MMRAAVAVALAVSGGLGCTSSPPTATRIDLRAYLARTQSWAPVEAETARTIDRILKTQFVDEAEVRRQIADSRPRVLAHLQALRSYQPRSKEVAAVHARYVEAWERLLGGYDAIEQGFSSGDYTKLARGREAMEAWREAMVAVARQLRELMQHFDVEASGPVESRAREGAPQRSMQSTKSSAWPAAIA
jgi:hypothetical protein